MALNYKIGAVQWLTTDALSSTKVVTGLGFAPKALKFTWVGIQSATNASTANTVNLRDGIGFAVSATSRRTVGSFGTANAGNADCGSVAASDCVVITVNGTGTIDGKLDISSFDSDGFTLIVNDVTPANITVFWEAWGGSDITVAAVGDIAEPAATGTVNYTVTGFTADGANQVVMFAGVQSTAAVGTGQAQDSGINLGYATSTTSTNQITLVNNSDDGSASSDTNGSFFQGYVINKITIAGGNCNAYAALSAWGTNLFTLNWAARASTGRRNIFLAIKGGIWDCNYVNIQTGTIGNTASVTGLSFAPIGLSVFTNSLPINGVPLSNAVLRSSYGMATSTTDRQAVSNDQPTGQPNMVINLGIAYDAILNAAGNNGLIDMNSFSSNGFEFIVDATLWSSSSVDIGYLTFGSQTPARIPRTTSVGHPFII